MRCVTDIKRLKGVPEILKEKSDEIRSVLPAVSFKKAVLKIFGKFLENHSRQSAYRKLIAMLNLTFVADVFLRTSRQYSEELF